MKNKGQVNLQFGLISLILIFLTGCKGDAEAQTTQSSYSIEEVSYESEGITLSGALWLPDTPGPHPAMVIAHGSGRSTKQAGRRLASHFASMGIAILSYDKRGVGDSGGTYVGRLNASEENLTLLAKDVIAGVRFLKGRRDIDQHQIGLYGWSQAGWIIPIAANMIEGLKFSVLISGPTVTVGEENYYSELTGNGSIDSGLTQEEMSRKLKEKGPYWFDPIPFLKTMDIPGLWVLGSADKSIPIPETVAILDRLIDTDKKDFHYKVFEGASHGININRQLAPGYWEVQDDFIFKKVKVKVKK